MHEVRKKPSELSEVLKNVEKQYKLEIKHAKHRANDKFLLAKNYDPKAVWSLVNNSCNLNQRKSKKNLR